MFKCTRCDEYKPADKFAKDSRKISGLTSHCKACRNEARKAHYYANHEHSIARAKTYKANNVEKVRVSGRNTKLKKAYGITHEDYLVMLKQQDHGCACCGRKDSEEPKNVLNIDHNHHTGKLRELLCFRCNTTIGLTDENEDRLLAIINYLRKHNG